MSFFRRLFAKQSKIAMLSLARDPDAANAALAAKKRALESGLLSERDLRAAVKGLRRDSGPYGIPAATLGSQGLHAEHVLLDALADPDFLRLTAASNHIVDCSPAETVLGLLAGCGGPDSESVLWRFVGSSDKHLRKRALCSLAVIAGEESLLRLSKHLGLLEPNDRKPVWSGISSRFYERAAAEPMKSRFVEILQEYVLRGDHLDDDVIQALGAVDKDAAARLLAEYFLKADAKDQYRLIRCMEKLDIPFVPAERSDPLAGIAERPSRAIALKLMASDHTLSAFETAWNDEISQGPPRNTEFSASIWADEMLDSLCIRLGHDSMYGCFYPDIPADELPPRILDIQRILDLDSEVCNGGWLQYFVNSAGANWNTALAACRRLGFADIASQIEEAVGIIGIRRTDTTRELIAIRLRDLTERQEKKLRDLDKRYFDGERVLKYDLAMYVHRDPARFRSDGSFGH